MLGILQKTFEEKFALSAGFPFKDNPTNRQIVGRMVKCILEQFGYEPYAKSHDERGQLRGFTGAKYFKTASVYKKTGAAAHSIKVEIV